MKHDSAIKSLIVINNDRYEGYKKASEEAKDPQLKSLFNGFSQQSRQFNTELTRFVNSDEVPEPDRTTVSGKAYRAWMDVKAALASDDRKAVLSSCEFGEDAALRTYREVLDDGEEIPEVEKSIIDKQKAEIQAAHNQIKSMRDQA
jgi:uncharacterized protein (TIGR02284 family)